MNRAIDSKTERNIAVVMERIGRSRLRRAKAMAAFHIAVLAGTVAGLAPAVRFLMERAYQSGFSEYASLIFYDAGYAVSSWRSLVLTLAESAPIASSAMVVAIAIVFFYAARGAMRDISAMRSLADLPA